MTIALAATGSNSALSYTLEDSYGVPPASPTMVTVRAKSGTKFDMKKDSFTSKEKSSTRQVMGITFGTRSGSCEIPFELSYGSFDAFLEATLGGTWATNVLKVGSVKRSFAFEESWPDINLREQNTGTVLTGFSLSVKPNAIVEGSFTGMFKDQASVQYADDGTTTIAFAAAGKTITRSAGSFVTDGFAVGDQIVITGAAAAGNNQTITLTGVTATVLTASGATIVDGTAATGVTISKTLGTPSAANTNSVFDSFTGVASIDGTTIAIVTGIDLKVDQSAAASNVLFDSSAQQISLGTVNVTGSMVVRFINNAIKKRFLNGTDTDISFTLGVTSKTYKFDMSKTKLTSSSTSTDETELTQTMAFTAIYDSSDASSLMITRVA